MRVLCIALPQMTVGPVQLEVGNFYHVIDEGSNKLIGKIGTTAYYTGPWYELTECEGYVHSQSLFIPCSEIDETEYAEEILNNIFKTA